MGQGVVTPDRGPRVRAQVVHESQRTRVTRLFSTERTLIRKEPLGPYAQQRLGHEMEMLQRLRGVEGVAQLAEATQFPGSIMLVDAGGRSLSGLAKPLGGDDLIELALELGRAVAGIHPSRHRRFSSSAVALTITSAACACFGALVNASATT
jgi:hypothetical protein